MDPTTLEMYNESVAFLQDRLPDQLRHPRVAIICGSGLGLLAENVEHNGKLSMSFDYTVVPHLPHSNGMTLYPRSACSLSFDLAPVSFLLYDTYCPSQPKMKAAAEVYSSLIFLFGYICPPLQFSQRPLQSPLVVWLFSVRAFWITTAADV
jgi:hypothetical protein